jgi:hypothetical protein
MSRRGVRWFPTKKPPCCGADWVAVSAVIEAYRGRPGRRRRVRSQMVTHGRGEERFWHWADQAGKLRP